MNVLHVYRYFLRQFAYKNPINGQRQIPFETLTFLRKVFRSNMKFRDERFTVIRNYLQQDEHKARLLRETQRETVVSGDRLKKVASIVGLTIPE
ncbi:hypothetical protein SJAG_06135 [Schizosaccharomyces japonicus yFS275]|uniref:Uncharacterized protein n=1 Tax=Schizosaccharomyces japonicus (strain yFS275 / FY16936) TaxID=402676 RepID=T0RSU6_SCHJY|nr:hypothetical protein SJAG_06135 [Schizosaccharomyces japonicus yFS275]EQC53010.1 hypothetical protein SJAG_06135 [Schizosaccharomyces japonicus yFS275]